MKSRLQRRVGIESLETRILCAADLTIDVSINGRAAGEIPMEIAFGSELDFIYEVRNSGDSSFRNLTISDDAGTISSADDFAPEAVSTAGKGVGEIGDLLATFNHLKASRFLQHPTKPLLYASIPSHNSIAVINTETLELEALVPIGSNPYGMAITQDGSKLYVANATSNHVAILNTETLSIEAKVNVKEPPLDVEVAIDGSLFVLSNRELSRIAPATGKVLEQFPVWAYSGELAINAKKDRLYYADYGLSPASLYVWDITTNPARFLWESPHGGSSGENGQDLALSHDGTFISYAAGYGQLGYRIAKYDTSDMAIQGTFDTGAYPREITFSPDDTFAYTVNQAAEIKAWDTNFFAQRGSIRTAGEATELLVDRTGRYLFAAFEKEIRVYSTGRSVGVQVNVGDSNSNGKLDPGETWRFESKVAAAAGRQKHRVAVAGTDSDSKTYFETSAVNYFGTLSAEVKENVKGVEAIVVPGVQSTVPDDKRFEIADGMLRTRLEIHLEASVDNAMRVRLLDETSRELLYVVDFVVHEDAIPWHNQSVPMDVNEDGLVSPLDALLVINDLTMHKARKLGDYPVGKGWQIDCNKDGLVSPVDALLVINALNKRGTSEGEGEGDFDIQPLPEQELVQWDLYLPPLVETWSSDSIRQRSKGRRHRS